MAQLTQPYLVVRLVPVAPVDGATFSTYLDGLSIQAVDANDSGPDPTPLSGLAYSSPLSMFQWQGSGPFLASVTVALGQSAAKGDATLTFTATDGIVLGAWVYSADLTTIPPSSNFQVAEVERETANAPGTVTLRAGNAPASLPSPVPAGTVVTFIAPSPSADPATALPEVFALDTTAPASAVDGQPVTPTNPLRILHFAAAEAPGIAVGMSVAGTGIPAPLPGAPAPTVTRIHTRSGATDCDVTVSVPLSGSPTSVTFRLDAPFASFERTPLTGSGNTLTFTAGDTTGIAVGMTLVPSPSAAAPKLIAAGTAVTKVTAGGVTLSRALVNPLPANTAVRFVFPLSSGIFQHVEQDPKGQGFLGLEHPIIPAAVATAILPLLTQPPAYLAVRVNAGRGAEIVPVGNSFHNVLWQPAPTPLAPGPATPADYQAILLSQTSLYVALPPPPGTTPIPLVVPEDGSPPPFDLLVAAMRTALLNDPIPGTTLETLNSSPALCRRVAYDIAWSSQNTLPIPADPLTSLYTNPPNPGGGGDTSSGQNNYEQDRQKFEGELSSFYSTRDANAERLAKFVAAASAAVQCEQTSLSASSALLTFPVDAPDADYGSAVSSELVVQGLGQGGSAGITFGVPAAFFYALGAHLDKSTTALQRYQMASGDAIDRVLLQLRTATDAKVISEAESFVTLPPILAVPPVSPFQAARRLSALSVSAAAAAARTMVPATSPLAALTTQWLAIDAPAPHDPPLTYAEIDFDAWKTQLTPPNATGYLALDLQALTQGYAIPTITILPARDAAAGASTLAFTAATDSDLSPGTPLSGAGLAAGTTITATSTDRSLTPPVLTVTLSAALTAPVTTATSLTVNATGTSLADRIADWLPGTTTPATAVPTVSTLKLVTTQKWNDFFTLVGPAWLPPFTLPVIIPGSLPAQVAPKPGYTSVRVRAFVRAVQRFFTVSSLATSPQPPDIDSPPTFDGPTPDLIGHVVGGLTGGFTFGTPLSAAALAAAVEGLSEGLDPPAAAWLTAAITTVNELTEIATATPAPDLGVHSLPYPVSLAFSVAEGLYARGFRGAADITALTTADFRLALTGTVGFDFADALYAKAETLAPSGSPTSTPEAPFAPANPDGLLTDCMPPATLSPTGPIGYLQEVLRLTTDATCSQPFPETTAPTLGDIVAARRGPLGDLSASAANLGEPVPLVDLVNECLEYLGATQPPAAGAATAPSGAVYDSEPDHLRAMPQHSTPAPPSAGVDHATSPLVWDRLKSDFSAAELPYAQALDVSRTHLRALGSNRFGTMRTFRRDITEFVLDPDQPPAGFEPWLWRYPVRTDIAVEYLEITPEEHAALFGANPPPAAGRGAPTLPPSWSGPA